MRPLAQLSISEYLDQTAARTPAPGGGAAAAIAGATAAALVQMAAEFAGDGDDTIAERAEALRARLLELADEDLFAYRPVLDALRRPRDDPGRAAALAAALTAASQPPLAIANAAADVAELAAEIAPKNEHLTGDANVAALLAAASAQAATRLVELNLAGADAHARDS